MSELSKFDVERAIIENRPGEPFVLIERVEGDDIEDLSALDWQANTESPTWDEVTAWLAAAELAAANAVATPAVADAAAREIVGKNLADRGVTEPLLAHNYQAFHGQAISAIPYYETFVGPDPAAAWAAFQGLDAATQQRLMFNLCRTVAAMMRYMTGMLPVTKDAATVLGQAQPSADEALDASDEDTVLGAALVDADESVPSG